MTGIWWEYLLVFGASAALCLVLTPVAMAVAIRVGVLDRPGGHKRHESPTPYLGGVAIVVAFSASRARSVASAVCRLARVRGVKQKLASITRCCCQKKPPVLLPGAVLPSAGGERDRAAAVGNRRRKSPYQIAVGSPVLRTR